MTQAVNLANFANNLDSSGGLNPSALNAAVSVAKGGTGATTASAARTNLSAAASGANSDITSLSGLTTALSVAQGGTGVTTIASGSIVKGNGTSAFSAASASDIVSQIGTTAVANATTSTSCSGNSSTATQLTTASGTAPSYSARAWVNFDGTGTVGTNMTIFGSGNVSSVYKNATGDYTVNFTTALPNANYAVSLGISSYLDTRGVPSGLMIKSAGLFTTTGPATKTTSALQVVGGYGNNGGGFFDVKEASLIIFC